MGTEDMVTIKQQIIRNADRISAYGDGMEKLAAFVGDLGKEIDAAHGALELARKRDDLSKTVDFLETMTVELKEMKSSIANISDKGSMVRKRIDEAARLVALIRDMDGRLTGLYKKFSTIRQVGIPDLMQTIRRLEESAQRIRKKLKEAKNWRQEEQYFEEKLFIKLETLIQLTQVNDKLQRKIVEKLFQSDGEQQKEAVRILMEIEKKEQTKENSVEDRVIPCQSSEYSHAQVNEGDYVAFGRMDEISLIWKVVEKMGDRLLLLSQYGLMTKAFHGGQIATWDESSLREYLNSEFVTKFFNYLEQEMIVTSYVRVNSNVWDKVKSGQYTEDKVFILGIAEANRYARSNDELKCFAMRNSHITKVLCNWWLRDQGYHQNSLSFVDVDGIIRAKGREADDPNVYVRPAMWIKPTGRISLPVVVEVGRRLQESEDARERPIDVETVNELEEDAETVLSLTEENVALSQSAAGNEKTLPHAHSIWYDDIQVRTISTNIQTGNIVSFGSWKGQKMLWRVLSRSDNKLWLMCLYGLRQIQVHTQRSKPYTWETCTLRSYLNTSFLETCFSSDEIGKILTWDIRYLDLLDESGGEFRWVTDKIYILNRKELEELGEEPKNLACLSIDEDHEPCEWWLRTPGADGDRNVVVGVSGKIKSKGRLGYGTPKVWVRPAMWVEV